MEGSQIDSTLSKMILKLIQEGDLSSIKENISKNNLDIKLIKDISNNQNAFFYAAIIKEDKDALEVFKYLKSLGLDPNEKDKFEQTCLYYTCRDGKNLCCEYLIDECKLDPNEIDTYGQNPIYYAVRDGRIDTINLMIEKGANINQIDKKKMTPYIFAERYGGQRICELLLKHGAVKSKSEKEKKSKKISKNKERENNLKETKHELSIEEIQKPKKYVLVQITQEGKKIPLNEEQLDKFKNEHNKIFNLLNKEEERKKISAEANQDLLYFDCWEKQAKKLMNSLWKTKDAELFHKPVDPVELGIPDYFSIIKEPMDFSTIKKKLTGFVYTNFKEFVDDIDLTFNNCYKYNGEKSPVGYMCTNVKKEYKKLYNQLGMDKFL